MQLTPNENENNLHSGPDGFEFMMWDAEVQRQSVVFHHFSPDGEQGFPGNFDVKVTYTLTDENAVEIHYEGTSDQDTVANMTNHSYFNLAAGPFVYRASTSLARSSACILSFVRPLT